VVFQTDYDKIKLKKIKLIMTKSNLKKSVMTSFQWRHRNYVTKKRHQTYVTKFFNFRPLPIEISGYASVISCTSARMAPNGIRTLLF